MEFEKDLSVGAVVRSLSTGLEGVIIHMEKDPGPSSLLMCVVEFRHGESSKISANDVALADHPFHTQLDAWHKEGRARGYEYLVIGQGEDGAWRRFFAHTTKGYGRIVREHSHLSFIRFWPLRRM